MDIGPFLKVPIGSIEDCARTLFQDIDIVMLRWYVRRAPPGPNAGFLYPDVCQHFSLSAQLWRGTGSFISTIFGHSCHYDRVVTSLHVWNTTAKFEDGDIET